MFNILIVDDDKDTADVIKMLIDVEIPDAKVETALTVEAARRAILEASRSRLTFDAFILDMKLPEVSGGHPEVDETLCRDVRKFMPKALVAHITAYLHQDGDDNLTEHEDVTKHLDRFHGKRFGNRAIWFWKLDQTYTEDLVNELKSFLYGQLIQEEIRRVFNLDEEAAPPTQSRKRFAHPRRGGRSLTHELGALTREISARWDALDEDVREHVKDIFMVREDGEEVIVSLFKGAPKEGEAEGQPASPREAKGQ